MFDDLITLLEEHNFKVFAYADDLALELVDMPSRITDIQTSFDVIDKCTGLWIKRAKCAIITTDDVTKDKVAKELARDSSPWVGIPFCIATYAAPAVRAPVKNVLLFSHAIFEISGDTRRAKSEFSSVDNACQYADTEPSGE